MAGEGAVSEVESATWMVLVGHFIFSSGAAAGRSKVDGWPATRKASNATIARMGFARRIGELLNLKTVGGEPGASLEARGRTNCLGDSTTSRHIPMQKRNPHATGARGFVSDGDARGWNPVAGTLGDDGDLWRGRGRPAGKRPSALGNRHN